MTDIRWLLFARSPYGPDIKTRLAPCCDETARRRIQHSFVLDSLAGLRRSAERLGGKISFHTASPWINHETLPVLFPLPAWLDEKDVVPQIEGAFGERLKSALKAAFGEGASKVIVIGGDTPMLPGALLQATVRGLDTHRVVLGPAEDGGYYLLGLSGPFDGFESLFEDIDWGSDRVFSQTHARCLEADLKTLVLPKYFDVDRCADLRRLARELTPAQRARTATGQVFTALGLLDPSPCETVLRVVE